MPLVSIIIPTYNRSQVWEEKNINDPSTLLYNLLNQTYTNFEVIIVNDGSTENTDAILSKLKRHDSRIKIINKDNGGLSSARNEGIRHAIGRYIFFVDDDDNIPLDYIASFMTEENEGVDLIIDSYSNRKNDNSFNQVDFEIKKFRNKNTLINHIFTKMGKSSYPFFAHGKRFKTELIKINNILFKDNREIIEDRPFLLDYAQFIESSRISNNHKYIVQDCNQDYRLSSSVRPLEKWWEVFRNGYEFLNHYADKYGHPEIKEYATNYLSSKILSYIIFPFNSYYSDKRPFFRNKILPYLRRELKSKTLRNKREQLLYSFLFLFGMKPTLWLLNIKSH